MQKIHNDIDDKNREKKSQAKKTDENVVWVNLCIKYCHIYTLCMRLRFFKFYFILISCNTLYLCRHLDSVGYLQHPHTNHNRYRKLNNFHTYRHYNPLKTQKEQHFFFYLFNRKNTPLSDIRSKNQLSNPTFGIWRGKSDAAALQATVWIKETQYTALLQRNTALAVPTLNDQWAYMVRIFI